MTCDICEKKKAHYELIDRPSDVRATSEAKLNCCQPCIARALAAVRLMMKSRQVSPNLTLEP